MVCGSWFVVRGWFAVPWIRVESDPGRTKNTVCELDIAKTTRLLLLMLTLRLMLTGPDERSDAGAKEAKEKPGGWDEEEEEETRGKGKKM